MSPRPWGILGVILILALAVPIGYVVISLIGALATTPVGFVLVASFIVGVVAAMFGVVFSKLKKSKGEKTMRVTDLMSANPVKCGVLDSIEECAKLMYHGNVGYLLVEDEYDRLVGTVTDRDLVCAGIAQGLDMRSTPVTVVMERDFVSIASDKSLPEALELMQDHGIRRLPVIDENDKCVGVLSVDDVIVAAACSIEELAPIYRRQLSEPRKRAA